RMLGLMNAEFTDELCSELVKAPLLKQLKHLDFSMGTMTDKGAAVLAANKKAFQHLESLDVEENFLTESGQAAVANLCEQVRFEKQRKPELVDGEPKLSVMVGE
ncbi:MAG: molybdenum metabolism regulator, partial [Pseudomonadota bacterium]